MKLCESCRYRNNTEYEKPCIVYRDDCEYYEKERGSMTREKAIHKMEYSKRAYQMLIDEKVQEGVLVGQGINAEWSADTPIIDAYKDMLEACDMAIKALEQEPCDDAISRDMALEKMADYVASGYADSVEDFEEYSRIICQLPLVTQNPDISKYRKEAKRWKNKWLKSQKSGKWEHGKEISREYRGQIPVNINYLDWHCSNCHCVVEQSIKPEWNYCPACGAKMESEDKE